MTLIAHFALKSVWGSAIHELAFLGFGQNLCTVSNKIVASYEEQ